MTNGGLGVAAFWPSRPNPVLLRLAPLSGFRRSASSAPVVTGLAVMLSELRWVWAPCLAVIAAALFSGRTLCVPSPK